MGQRRLVTAKRVSASTALLDDDNAIISPPQREALKHQQLAEDKTNVAVRLAEVQQQLAQAEQKLEREKADLATFQKERARLIVDKLSIKEVSDKIMLLETSVEQGPAVIACLRERIADLQAEQKQVERDHNLSEQKESARLIERLSKELVELLRKALEVNTTLQACSRNYCKLKALTNTDVVSSRVCQGSDGSLQQLYGICKAECEGKRGIRPPFCVGQTPL